jgi:N-acetyl-alpha-D-muramate 1-phosphate uridylyltransferase
LRPLTRIRPKPLCPVANVPLVDHAVAAVQRAVLDVAVNVHHGRQLMEAHLAGRVHLSFEDDGPLGTAGAVGHLRDWLDGRGVLIVNADTWHRADLGPFVAGWDGERIRVLLGGPEGTRLGPGSLICASLLPWAEAVRLPAEPAGLYEVSWRAALDEERLEEAAHDGPVIPCDTPRDYLEANLVASGGTSVVGAGALVEGEVDQCVIWPGAHVRPEERLHRTIRAGRSLTVLVR